MKNLITNSNLSPMITSNLSEKNKIKPYKLFSRLLAIFGLTMVLAVTGWSADECSVTSGYSQNPLVAGTPFTKDDEVGRTSTSEFDTYYFNAPSAGIVTVTLTNIEDDQVRFTLGLGVCPGTTGAKKSETLTLTTDLDFNVKVYKTTTSNNTREYTITVTFTPTDDVPNVFSDLCYTDIRQEGDECEQVGYFYYGENCLTTQTIVNQNTIDPLTSVEVYKVYAPDLDSGSCATSSAGGCSGPETITTSAGDLEGYTYDLETIAANAYKTISDTNSNNSGDEITDIALYGQYQKGGITYSGEISACDAGSGLVFYDAGRVDAVDKYLTDGHALGTGLKTRVGQKSYAPDTSTNPNLYSVDAVYLGADQTNAETYDAADMPVFFYLVDDNCENYERLKDNSGDWLTAIVEKDDIYGTTPAFTLTEVQRRRRLAMRYIDYEALITEGGPNCLQNSSQGANAVPGLPSCVASDVQYLDSFHQEAFDRCKVENGEPCLPSHHGYSGGGDPTYPGYTEQYDHEYGCYECTLGSAPGVCSSDNFAIRPNHFNIGMTHPDTYNLLRAGQDYNVSITANNEDNTIQVDYNVTDHNWVSDLDTNVTKYFKDGTEDTEGLLAGTTGINTSITAYSVAGKSRLTTSGSGTAEEVIPISYNDVGKINLQVFDREWAEVDNDDTPMDCDDSHAHTYICGDENVTFIPHHFGFSELNITNHAGPDSNFTYVADKRGMPSTTLPIRSPMAARVQTRIKALTKDGNTTLNFKAEEANYPYSEIDETTRRYYEHPVNVSFVVTVPSTGTNQYLYPDANETNTTTIADPNLYNYIGFGRAGKDINGSGTRDILWNESNFPLDFNFQREINEPANPFDVNGTYLKSIKIISHYVDPDDSTKTADINGSRLSEDGTCTTGDAGCVEEYADNNATFYYGRTRSSKYYYEDITDNNVTTPIFIDIYCDLGFTACDNFGINTTEGQTNEYKWWLSWYHNESNGDGNITLEVGTITPSTGTGSASVDTDVTITSEGKDDTINVRYGSGTKPMIVEIDLDDTPSTNTNHWLIYNPDDAINTPTPFYKVQFKGTSGWAGHGQTGYVVDSNASTKKNRRLGW